LSAKELDQQIGEYLARIQISERFKDWAIKYLHELHEKESASRNDIIQTQQKAYGQCLGRIDNLIKLKTSGRLPSCRTKASRTASQTIGISRSRLPIPRTEIVKRSISMSAMFAATTSLTLIPVENISSTSAVSLIVRTLAAMLDPFWTRTAFSKDLTVDRPTVRGKLSPTFTSLRIPASGFSGSIEFRSRFANIDFTVASLRRIVRGWAAVMLQSQRWTNFRSIALIVPLFPDAVAKAPRCARSNR
jgi:hypothetical protein